MARVNMQATLLLTHPTSLFSMAKVATDGRQLHSFYTMLKGASFDDMDVALEGLHKVGPGGHFFGEEYTMDHLPYLDEVQDNKRYDSWVAEGSKTVSVRGRDWCKNRLARYEETRPTLDNGTDEALQEFVTRREKEITTDVK